MRKGAVLTVAALAIGVLTTLSGVFIELASDLLADLRHGVCVQRQAGDARPFWDWEDALIGGWRPYDRMRCCGGSASVDHATQECRVPAPVFPHHSWKRHNVTKEKQKRMFLQVDMADVRFSTQKSHQKVLHPLPAGRHEHFSSQGKIALEQHETGTIPHLASLAEEAERFAVTESALQLQRWVPWERALLDRFRLGGLAIYVIGSAILAFYAAIVTRSRPAARGSGIPEVKASVAGFAVPTNFHAKTLAAKVCALSLCVGAGLAVGKEGPMIHIGSCWAVLLITPLSRLGRLDVPLVDTELICVGAAAGVATAFGAPLAGVLFAVEELGTTMPSGLRYTTMICALASAVVAAMMLKWLDLTSTQRITLFEVNYKQAWAPWEAVVFALLGVVGGVLGGAFVWLNEVVNRRRLVAESEGGFWFFPACIRRRILWFSWIMDARVVEVILLALATSASNYQHPLSRMLQNDAIKALFSQCPSESTRTIPDPVGVCVALNSAGITELLHLLIGAAALRFVQIVFTFGALTPAGLFVPSMFIGGCIGRAVGSVLRYADLPGGEGVIEPGIYAMVGAGAMLAGVSRLTVSLAVVLFELTGGLTYVVPFMLAVLMAKWTGDVVTNGSSAYDVHAEIRGLAKVEQSDDIHLLNATLQDLRSCCVGTNCESIPTRKIECSEPWPPFWVPRNGFVHLPDLMAHCKAACGVGFAVMLWDGVTNHVEMLGWIRPRNVLAAVEAHGDIEGNVNLCRLVPEHKMQQPVSGKLDHKCHLDLSSIVEPQAVVQVRPDCSLNTALCAFRSQPSLAALVSVEEPYFSANTMTREFFFAMLLHGHLQPIPSQPPKLAESVQT